MSESDETVKLSLKTWERTIDIINKNAYSDGAVDGQNTSFQSSFDMGYKQGFEFGLNLGFRKALEKHSQETTEDKLLDPRRINCQICINNNTSNENIVNLYNKQLEKNINYLL